MTLLGRVVVTDAAMQQKRETMLGGVGSLSLRADTLVRKGLKQHVP